MTTSHLTRKPVTLNHKTMKEGETYHIDIGSNAALVEITEVDEEGIFVSPVDASVSVMDDDGRGIRIEAADIPKILYTFVEESALMGEGDQFRYKGISYDVVHTGPSDDYENVAADMRKNGWIQHVYATRPNGNVWHLFYMSEAGELHYVTKLDF